MKLLNNLFSIRDDTARPGHGVDGQRALEKRQGRPVMYATPWSKSRSHARMI